MTALRSAAPHRAARFYRLVLEAQGEGQFGTGVGEELADALDASLPLLPGASSPAWAPPGPKTCHGHDAMVVT
jgi:hypothetical protein